MRYAKVALGLPIDSLFDYVIPETLVAQCSPGSRVVVPFTSRSLLGYVTGVSAATKIGKVKPLIKLIDLKPILDDGLLRLTKMVSEYYCSSWGEAIQSALPVGLRKGLPVTIAEDGRPKEKMDGLKATFIQSGAFEEKYKMYCTHIDKTLDEGKSVIVLSPEIKSCFTIFDALRQRYSDKAEITYRKQKMREELRIWEKAKNGSISILVGTRPAVFAPFSHLGLLIVDEEDAYGYKEEQAPYYHARDVALMRAQSEGIPLVFSSATPSLESYYAVKRKKYQLISLNNQEIKQPKVTIADMRQYSFAKHKARVIISSVLEDRIRKAVACGKKTLIFINRKGFSRYAYCQKCGFILSCDKCSSKLIFSFEEKKLICSSCGLKKNTYSLCPQCGAHYIKYAGFGIEKVISQLHLLFPQAKIERIDKEHQTISSDFQILAATEMIFHQGSIHKADIAAVIDLDSAINIINFRSNEKIYALLYRLRNLAKDELIIQTGMLEEYLRKKFINLDLPKLYEAELKERRALELPPFIHLAMLRLKGKNLERIKREAFALYEKLKGADGKVSVFEPVESRPLKLRGKFHLNILLKAKNPSTLAHFIRKHLKMARHSGIMIAVDIDPQ